MVPNCGRAKRELECRFLPPPTPHPPPRPLFTGRRTPCRVTSSASSPHVAWPQCQDSVATHQVALRRHSNSEPIHDVTRHIRDQEFSTATRPLCTCYVQKSPRNKGEQHQAGASPWPLTHIS